MTPLPKTLQDLLAALPDAAQLDFARLQEALYRVRFTGPVTFDYSNGVPRQINLGPPVRLAICWPEREEGREGVLDKAKPSDPHS